MMYGPEIQDRTDKVFLSFLPFYHLDNLENQNSEKMVKKPGYIIILQRCTMNDGHMMYSS